MLALALLSSTAMAYESYDNAEVPFDAAHNMTGQTTITWRTVDNVQKECEAESRRRGFNGFGYPLAACSWQNHERGEECLIITSKHPNMHTLGHEMRHCFQGEWHK